MVLGEFRGGFVQAGGGRGGGEGLQRGARLQVGDVGDDTLERGRIPGGDARIDEVGFRTDEIVVGRDRVVVGKLEVGELVAGPAEKLIVGEFLKRRKEEGEEFAGFGVACEEALGVGDGVVGFELGERGAEAAVVVAGVAVGLEGFGVLVEVLVGGAEVVPECAELFVHFRGLGFRNGELGPGDLFREWGDDGEHHEGVEGAVGEVMGFAEVVEGFEGGLGGFEVVVLPFHAAADGEVAGVTAGEVRGGELAGGFEPGAGVFLVVEGEEGASDHGGGFGLFGGVLRGFVEVGVGSAGLVEFVVVEEGVGCGEHLRAPG